MAKRPELLVVNGELSGRRFAIGSGGLRLGRSSSNDIHMSDEELSRNHCLFEPVGEDGVRLTDLASANGTIVNGSMLGGDSVSIVPGDVIEVGTTIIKVVQDDEPSVVDLGLGAAKEVPDAAPPAAKRSALANILWGVAALVVVGAIAVVLLMPPPAADQSPEAVREVEPELEEFWYERVDATQDKVFRYELTYFADGTLKVVVDDVPEENRHLTKSEVLNDQAKSELSSILGYKALSEMDPEYIGVEPDPPALSSWTLKAVYSTCEKTIRIVNVQEPDAFRQVRERLDAFSKNQLGVWALQYSREKLMELAGESIRVGQSRWEDRDVQHGNLFMSVASFREALFYLETVNPKPECAETARRGLDEATAELERRYADQRFRADRAINMGEWETARRELAILMEMVPNRADSRNREAAAKLVDVEKRLKGGKAR